MNICQGQVFALCSNFVVVFIVAVVFTAAVVAVVFISVCIVAVVVAFILSAFHFLLISCQPFIFG